MAVTIIAITAIVLIARFETMQRKARQSVPGVSLRAEGFAC